MSHPNYTVRTKALLRVKQRLKLIIYWPHLMEDIKNYVESCQIRHDYQHANTKEPLMPYEVPKLPWR